ncbi:MAG TPA: NAD-dependent deacylase [Terriglobia bacterium]|nr:NAD-dependent deacylase [Terriglobia bacterium]
MTAPVDDLRAAIQRSRAILALTGAGISAESGIPTFRGPGGLWRSYSPEQLATPDAFARDPLLVWTWYDWRRGIIRGAEPNPGHRALAELEKLKGAGFTLVTQNVDGLHERAGSRRVVKLHGDIWKVRCTGCGASSVNDEVPLPELPPRCSCGALLRPGVVWFGESLPEDEWERAVEASRGAEVFLVAGTSAAVYPAAGLAALARARGAKIAVVNPEDTPLDGLADWVLRGLAGEVLPRLAG